MPRAIIGRRGRTLAVRLPASAARDLLLAEGGHVDIEVEGETIVIRKAAPKSALADMFAGKSAQKWRSLYRESHDWGPDLGREAVDP